MRLIARVLQREARDDKAKVALRKESLILIAEPGILTT
jgi:hypothetical protein